MKRFWLHYRTATAARIAQDPATARTYFDSALALQPQHHDALYYGGNAAFELGRFAEAEQLWRRELADNEHSARAHAQIGMLYSIGHAGAPFDLIVAQQELEAAHLLNRAETGPLVRLGEVSLLQADTAAANRWLAAAAQTNARSLAAVYLRGYLAWDRGDFEQAQVLLTRAAHLGSGSVTETSASAEGQTKRGNRPLLEGRRTSELGRFWRRLQKDGSADSARTAGNLLATTEYGHFDRALNSARERLARPPVDG